MSASVTVGYLLGALAAWAAIRALYGVLAHRSRTWKLALTIAGLGLGVGPALAGRSLGYVGVIVGGLASASLVADLAEQRAGSARDRDGAVADCRPPWTHQVP